MEQIVEQFKAEFGRAKEQMTRALATTPDDRINWSPSPTARTPIQQVAHSAQAIAGIQAFLTGQPFPFAGTAEADAAFRAHDKEFTTREQVLELLDKNSCDYLAWVDTLTAEQLTSTIQSPFGPIQLSNGITFAANHMRDHTSQIQYIQTIYGDHDWYI